MKTLNKLASKKTYIEKLTVNTILNRETQKHVLTMLTSEYTPCLLEKT